MSDVPIETSVYERVPDRLWTQARTLARTALHRAGGSKLY